MIDLTFYGRPGNGRPKRSATEQRVLDAWHEYHDHLSDPVNQNNPNPEAVASQRDELFVGLLAAMATDLNYQFDRVSLRKSWYTPQMHGDVAGQQVELLKAATDVFAGRTSLKIKAS